MSTILLTLLVFVAVGVAMWLISHVAEALRPAPDTPGKLRWAPDVPVDYVEVSGDRLRYLKTGTGPNLVLLHTLRTQLDLFEKVVRELAQDFTVYALDYPGHGYSDIPDSDYDADFFVAAVEGFLDGLDLKEVTLAGVSIGGSISLIIAGRGNTRVRRVVAINPYDYAKGRGMARSSPLGWMMMAASDIPVVGETVMRLRNSIILKIVLRGGVADPTSISPEFLVEMNRVGNRSGHYRAFTKLLRNAESWEDATKAYANIKVPVLLLWGDKDWAKPAEREHDRNLIPGADMETIERGGHFLPLDRPDAVIAHIREFHG